MDLVSANKSDDNNNNTSDKPSTTPTTKDATQTRNIAHFYDDMAKLQFNKSKGLSFTKNTLDHEPFELYLVLVDYSTSFNGTLRKSALLKLN